MAVLWKNSDRRARRHRAGALVVVAATAGCGVRHVPPPEAPPRVVPEIPEVPEGPPPEGTGRLLIDTEQEPAKVMRVTETTEGTLIGYPGIRMNGSSGTSNNDGYPGVMQKTELLCITPCAVDLRIGAQTLVFTSMKESTKTSSADVAVPRGTTVVRHALGSEKPFNGGCIGGAALMLAGSGVTLATASRRRSHA